MTIHQFLLRLATLKHDLENLVLWKKQLDMEFNPSNCYIIHISNNKIEKVKIPKKAQHGTIENVAGSV
jgi:hypothetical protein